MRKLAGRIAALIILPAAFAGAALTMSAAPASAAIDQASFEAQVITLTNQQRAKYGCAAVGRNDALARSARWHSNDMVTRHYFSHVSPSGSTFVTRAKAAGYSYASAENIAYGQQTAASVVTAWMNSSGHRANILNCANKRVGIGVSYTSSGVLYWTQVFGRV